MSIGAFISKLKGYFNGDDEEQLRKCQGHLESRLTTLLLRPRKTLRIAIDGAADDKWKQRILDEEQEIQLYTGK